MEQQDLDYCAACGCLLRLRGMPYEAKHIYGPVTDVARGRDFPGHPVTELPGQLEETS